MREPKVVVVGSVNMDLSVRVPHLPRAGETVSGGDLERGAGGKGANQAVAARLLGARTAIVGRVGEDEFGTEVRAALVDVGVDVSGLAVVGAATGTALIVIDPDGENMITISPGANGELRPGDLGDALTRPVGRVGGAAAADSDPDAGYAESASGSWADRADALLLQLEVPIATCTAAARAARAAGIPVILNAAPLPQEVGADLRELIALADVLIVNEGEAEGLLGARMSACPDPHNFVRDLRGLGPREAIVTLGSAGAMFIGDDDRCAYVPAFPVDAIDAVGAGDAFCAAFTVARASGTTDLGDAVRRASAAGALAATRRGAQSALPTKAEVDDFLAQRSTRES